MRQNPWHMYLKTNTYSVEQKPRGAFITALEYGDVSAMRRWARPFLATIRTGRPQVRIPDEDTIRLWEARSLVFVEQGRRHGYHET
jgi:hypothetical protein